MGKTKEKLITEKQIYLQEIENVKANRFLTNREKELKINELSNIIKKKKDE